MNQNRPEVILISGLHCIIIVNVNIVVDPLIIIFIPLLCEYIKIGFAQIWWRKFAQIFFRNPI